MFSNCEKSYILIGDSQCTLDFINYQDSSYLFKSEFEIEERLRPPHSPPRNNLYFEPPTSSEDSDCSDYTDLLANHISTTRADRLQWKRKQKSTTVYNWFVLFSNHSVQRESPKFQEDTPNVQSSPSGTNSPVPGDQPATPTRGRPPGVRNRRDTWKNTAAPAWRPLAHLKIKTDPDYMAYRTRL